MIKAQACMKNKTGLADYIKKNPGYSTDRSLRFSSSNSKNKYYCGRSYKGCLYENGVCRSRCIVYKGSCRSLEIEICDYSNDYIMDYLSRLINSLN